MVRHILAQHGHDSHETPALEAADAVQMSIRHTGPLARVTTAPRSGVHTPEGHGLSRTCDGVGLLECGPADCLVVNVPRPGTLVHPGSMLARLACRTALTTPDGRALNSHGQFLTNAVKQLYSFEAVLQPTQKPFS